MALYSFIKNGCFFLLRLCFKMSLEIVVGPMFSGKSTYALSYAKRYRSIGKRVIIVKPNIDNRYTDEHVIISHDGEQLPCVNWDVYLPFDDDYFLAADCIVFEEAQFFRGLKCLVKHLVVFNNKNVLLVGLDGDASQETFGEVLECIPLCNKLIKLNSYCSVCNDGTLAPYTKRINHENSTEQIHVGGSEMYRAVCLKHL
jgi:thymidine kinase